MSGLERGGGRGVEKEGQAYNNAWVWPYAFYAREGTGGEVGWEDTMAGSDCDRAGWGGQVRLLDCGERNVGVLVGQKRDQRLEQAQLLQEYRGQCVMPFASGGRRSKDVCSSKHISTGGDRALGCHQEQAQEWTKMW